MTKEIQYNSDLKNVDWQDMKKILAIDHFDNGRTPQQLQKSFENSYASVIAYAGSNIIGTARVLSDGVCNGYIVDVWTVTKYRRQGIASNMIKILMEQLEGQHIYLFADEAIDLYKKLGFKPQPTGLGRVVGQWLKNERTT